MRIFRNYLLLYTLLLPAILLGQDPEFGEVSEVELKSKTDPNFPEANAVVLYRHVNNYMFNYVEIHERIKIFNKEGFENATIFIPYTDVGKIKGATYTLENGVIVKTELDKNLIFEDEVIKDVEFKKFTFPNVSEGSVIEYKYKTESGSFRTIDLHYDIPIRNEKVVVTNRSKVGTEILQNPRAFLNLNRLEDDSSTIFRAKNVPALEPENYVYDMDMYRSHIRINLTSLANEVNFYNWESLAGNIVSVDKFGQGAKPKKFYKDDIETVISGKIDDLEQAKAIYTFLKDKVTWNKDYGVIPNESTRSIYADEEGNVSGINILYVSMLRSVGIEAYPLMTSTKLNGIPITASLSSFNSTLAYIKIAQKEYVVDVAHPKSTFNYLGTQFLNWEGIMVDQKEKTYKWIPLKKYNSSAKNIMANATIDEDLLITGDVRERGTRYFAVGINSKLKDLGENNQDEILEYDKDGLYITDINANVDKEDIVDISFNFEIENVIDEIDNKLYFNPLLFFAVEENPFQKEERKYTIDFGYPFKKQYIITVKIPETYQVETVPEPTKMVVEGVGGYTLRMKSLGNSIQIMAQFEINNAELSFDKYAQIKQFFKLMIEKENEKIVLTKG